MRPRVIAAIFRLARGGHIKRSQVTAFSQGLLINKDLQAFHGYTVPGLWIRIQLD